MRYGIVISHDATLVISALIDAGGDIDKDVIERQVSPRLSSTFDVCWDYLLDSGIIQQLYVAAVPKASKPPISFSKKSETKQRRKAVRDLVARTTDSRNFNGNYQAVVAGSKARRDPVQEYAAEMSPIDRVDFYKNWMKLSEADQEAYRRRIARLDYRSGRN